MGNAAGKWFESATGMDLDDALAYQTPKIVMIRDRTLGLLHYSFLAVILFYIIGFVMIMEKGYLEGDYPVAATRSTLREPGPTAVDFCGQTLLRQSFDDLDYCAQGKPDCEYCRDCIYSDWRGVVYPPELRDAMFITTRITTTEEELVCDPVADIDCFEPYQETSSQVVFVANIEDYTIGLFHSVRAANFFEEKVRDGDWDFEGTGNSVYKQLDTAGSNRYLKGRLSDLQGNTVCEFPSDDLDVIPVATLLAAGSLDDLDNPSDLPEEDPDSFRYEGLVVALSIDYFNSGSSNYTIGYTYRAVRLPGVDYKIEEIQQTETGRRVLNRHGVMILIQPAGTIFRVSFQAALVQLVSGLALTATAATVVDIVATKVLPLRRHYAAAKTQKTADFSDVKHRILEEQSKSNRTKIARKYGAIEDDEEMQGPAE